MRHLVLFLSLSAAALQAQWVTGYWLNPPDSNLPVAAIDYSALTHVIQYSVLPNGDGSLNAVSLANATASAPALIAAAHAHGVKVLLSFAATSSGGDFYDATAPATLSTFVDNIFNVLTTYGYDGVDIDWEQQIDGLQFQNLVSSLRSRLDAPPFANPGKETTIRERRRGYTQHGLLTGAFYQPAYYLTAVAGSFDQINVETYDMCSPDDGFTWHNAALYDAGVSAYRSVQWRMGLFAASGIPPSKLGVGIPFYGYLWQGGSGTSTGGVTEPGQGWTTAPSMNYLDYHSIVGNSSLWQTAYQQRDVAAGNVPYLSIATSSDAGDMFITYDDETSVAAKVAYAHANGFGGIMIYELSGDYSPGANPQSPLLAAVKTAVFAAQTTPLARPDRK
jgi:chitinase